MVWQISQTCSMNRRLMPSINISLFSNGSSLRIHQVLSLKSKICLLYFFNQFEMKFFTSVLLLASSFIVKSQPVAIKQYVADEKNRHRWLKEYVSFLSIPNVMADTTNIIKNAN